MGYLLFLSGLAIVGASLYGLYGNRIMNLTDERNTELDALIQNGRHVNLSQYEPLPQPLSLKPFFIALALAMFGTSLYLIYYLVNYSETVAGKFWMFILMPFFFGFGCYFLVLVGKADEKLEKKQKSITAINTERIKHRAQAIRSAYLELEEEKKAQLTQIQLNHAKEIAENQKIKIENERNNALIIKNLFEEAAKLGIPTDSLANLNAEKLRAEIDIWKENEIQKNQTLNKFEQDLNTEKVKSFGDGQKIMNITRTQYDKLSSKLLKDIGDLKEKIQTTKEDRSIKKTLKKIRIDNFEKEIEDKEFQLNELRAGLVKADNGEERRGLNT